MTLKNWPIYVPAFVALLVGLALWGASELQQPDMPSPSPPTNQPLAIESSQTNVRPAAVPQNDEEWSAIQKFVQDTWLVAHRQGQAQQELKKLVAELSSKGDLDGVDGAFAAHMSKLEKLMADLEGLQVPQVGDEDTGRFIADASESINATLVLEMEQTDWFIKGWGESGKAPPEDVVISSNGDINRNSARLLLSLHRIYWNHGYRDADIDERTFKLRPGVKPQPTTSFNRTNI